jgi:hypothetical protein
MCVATLEGNSHHFHSHSHGAIFSGSYLRISHRVLSWNVLNAVRILKVTYFDYCYQQTTYVLTSWVIRPPYKHTLLFKMRHSKKLATTRGVAYIGLLLKRHMPPPPDNGGQFSHGMG